MQIEEISKRALSVEAPVCNIKLAVESRHTGTAEKVRSDRPNGKETDDASFS
jgi:hypothetical protein